MAGMALGGLLAKLVLQRAQEFLGLLQESCSLSFLPDMRAEQAKQLFPCEALHSSPLLLVQLRSRRMFGVVTEPAQGALLTHAPLQDVDTRSVAQHRMTPASATLCFGV